MDDFSAALAALDTGLFQPIKTQTSRDDKRSLLLLQHLLRQSGPYTYLEIGSHLGGTIQPHFADPRCALIYSIDKRPMAQPDERGRVYQYRENSTARMLDNLRAAYPAARHDKIVTFDCDAQGVAGGSIHQRPQLCFIDGEHTNPAVWSDFQFCRRVCHPDAIIAFHDTCYIFEGITRIKRDLQFRGASFAGVKLGGSVYAILLGQAVAQYHAQLAPLAQDELVYFDGARRDLARIHRQNRFPVLRLLDVPKKIVRKLKRHAG